MKVGLPIDMCRGEAGHKVLAKIPGRKIDPKQQHMNHQLAGQVRFHNFNIEIAKQNAAAAAAARAASDDPEDVEGKAHRMSAKEKAEESGRPQFLATAESVRMLRLRGSATKDKGQVRVLCVPKNRPTCLPLDINRTYVEGSGCQGCGSASFERHVVIRTSCMQHISSELFFKQCVQTRLHVCMP